MRFLPLVELAGSAGERLSGNTGHEDSVGFFRRFFAPASYTKRELDFFIAWFVTVDEDCFLKSPNSQV